jgi:ATP-dependent protease ClpP protease subunit
MNSELLAALAAEAGAAGLLSATVRCGPLAPRAETLEMRLDGEVGYDITAAGVAAVLDAAPAGGAITVRINSPGGSPFEAIAIVNALRRHGGPVAVVIDPYAASAASLIAMAGSNILMQPNATMMIHRASTIAIGNVADMARAQALLERVDALQAELYVQRTGRPRAEITAAMEAETWFDAEAAVEFGLATGIAEDSPAPALAARFDPARFRRTPAALVAAMAPSRPPVAHQPPLENPMPTLNDSAAPPAMPASLTELRALANRARLPDGWVLDQVAANVTMDQARDSAIDAVAAAAPDRCAPVIANPLDNGAGRMRRAMEEALVARMSGGRPSADARPFMSLSLVEMIRSDLEARGQNVRREKPDALLIRALGGPQTTSDYPNLLTGAGQRFLLDVYARAQSPLRAALARVRRVDDFRAITVLRLGEAPLLEKVPESGAITYGSTKESAEAYKVATYAKIFGLSREAMINDDLMAFADYLRVMAAGGAETEARLLVSLLTDNSGAGGDLADGNPLFHSSRGNALTGAGSALTGDASGVSALGTARAAMRKTTGLDSLTPIAADPAFLLCSPDTETAADQVTTAITPRGVADANPFGGTITKLVEPRLSGAPWFLFANPMQAPVIEVAYLQGSGPGPILSTEEGFDTLGVKFRAVLDFGCGLVGWRGAVRSAGA